MKNKLATNLATGLLALGITTGITEAALFQGSTNGIFVNPDTGVNTGVGTSSFGTGTIAPTTLDFTGAIFNVNPDTVFSFGTLTYYNGTNGVGSTANTVDLDVTIDLTAPLGLTEDFFYSLSFNMTANTGTPQQNADYLYLPTVQPSANFLYAGTNYTLAFVGFGAMDSNGFITTVDQFHVLEGASSSATLYGKFTQYTATSIPEPTTILLLSMGAVYFAGTRRRKNTQQRNSNLNLSLRAMESEARARSPR